MAPKEPLSQLQWSGSPGKGAQRDRKGYIPGSHPSLLSREPTGGLQRDQARFTDTAHHPPASPSIVGLLPWPSGTLTPRVGPGGGLAATLLCLFPAETPSVQLLHLHSENAATLPQGWGSPCRYVKSDRPGQCPTSAARCKNVRA